MGTCTSASRILHSQVSSVHPIYKGRHGLDTAAADVRRFIGTRIDHHVTAFASLSDLRTSCIVYRNAVSDTNDCLLRECGRIASINILIRLGSAIWLCVHSVHRVNALLGISHQYINSTRFNRLHTFVYCYTLLVLFAGSI